MKNILISGAGIAGLTLAYWLKSYGFTPTLVERHPVLRTEGYKLDIRGAAIDVVKRMGLFDEIFQAQTQIQRSQFVDRSGKILQEVDPNLCGVRATGDLEIVRGRLCEILFNRVGEVRHLFGDAIQNLAEDEEGILVEFEKGGRERFDLVIGADGLHSRVRQLVFGKEPQFLHELGLYISFYSIPNFLDLDRVEIEYHGEQRFAIAYSAQDGMAKAGFAFAAAKPQGDLFDSKRQKEFLREAFANEGWKIPELLTLIDESPDFYFDCVAQVRMAHWTRGRVALVGDAGYAVSPLAGQGNSVALIGAYLLAGELAEAGGEYPRAFEQYENQLRLFVEKNQKLAEMSVALVQNKNIFLKLIRQLARLLPGRWVLFWKNLGLKRTTQAANAIQLKEYNHGR